MVSTFNVLLSIFTVFLCSSGILADLAPERTYSALDLHNQYRLAVNNPPAADMLEMTWDDELADKAQGWADNCEFAYDPKHYTAKYDSVGQNLYSSDELVDIFQNATATWAEEKDYYIYDYPCPAGQVIWAKSYKLGMAVSSRKCPFGQYLVVANYAKGGYLGEPPYTAGTPASQCPAGSQPGASGMCEVTDEDQLRETIGLSTHKETD
ncbi:hypothetical protein N7533_002724 [Penicillium manginii]|uniref:uncharacterized protein n=1 Tax=Penicillium manginii TaxID=203109 RepID=UPI0025490066|nr:uncharacterized protein N7533_002724 [Penicillium manginii]KAJ5764043.1 hypothetical protein N7533_002724 [Penicillium manginii]